MSKTVEQKNRLHPVRAWLCFALAITLLLSLTGTAVIAADNLYEYRSQILRIIPKIMRLEYFGTDLYWEDTLAYLDYLNDVLTGQLPLVSYDAQEDLSASGTTDSGDADTVTPILFDNNNSAVTEPFSTDTTAFPHSQNNLPIIGYQLADDAQAGNLRYTAFLGDTKISSGSFISDTVQGLAWVDGELYVLGIDTTPIPGDSGYSGRLAKDVPALREYLRDIGSATIPTFAPDATILLLTNTRIIDSGGLLDGGMEQTYMTAAICWVLVALVVLIVALFVGVFIDRRSKAAADEAIGRFLGRIWIELRLFILVFAVLFYIEHTYSSSYALTLVCFLATGWLWVYFIAADLRANGLRTFTCNCLTSIICFFRRQSARLPLHKALARRWLIYLLPAAVCAFTALLFLAPANTNIFFFVTGIYFSVGAIALFVLYFRVCREDYEDIARLMNRICEIREGRATAPLSLPPTHRFAPYATALEDIYAGIETAVAERTKSERTKIEMITNISHDLKTPLTSIVGYADLLANVEGLPPEAADYVLVISQKSARLNALIKDLFDLSKATTNDLPLRTEPLDLVRLLNQLLAEQADAIASAPVTLVTDLPAHECPLENDGTKLYRIFANLLENALRYALDGSRIFLTLHPANDNGRPVWRVTFKNTSREYIDFTADEILCRFVRGDKNRSTEGNGLGLPIAKSFTELCGGRFELTLDGDIFCVTVDFPQSGVAPTTAE